ncbi:hypothetical protein CN594_31015, partial [Bacillus toyonensis]
ERFLGIVQLHKRNYLFDLDSFSYWNLFFFMFSNEKHVFGMPFFLIKLSSYENTLQQNHLIEQDHRHIKRRFVK